MSFAAMSLDRNGRGEFNGTIAPSTQAQTTMGSHKPRSQSLWRIIAWPLVLTCGFLIFVTGSSIYLVVSSQSASELVNRTLQVETKLLDMVSTIRNAESGQRGYLLTGDPKYLDTYHIAASAIVPTIADLKGTITDTAQQKALADLEPFVERKFAELADTIRLYDTGNGAAALALVRSDTGLDLMTEIRARTTDMTEEEQRLFSPCGHRIPHRPTTGFLPSISSGSHSSWRP